MRINAFTHEEGGKSETNNFVGLDAAIVVLLIIVMNLRLRMRACACDPQREMYTTEPPLRCVSVMDLRR